MTKDKLTPEEKLLKLIEGQGGDNKPDKDKRKASGPAGLIISGLHKFSKPGLAKWKKQAKTVFLTVIAAPRFLNGCLVTAAAILAVMLVISINSEKIKMGQLSAKVLKLETKERGIKTEQEKEKTPGMPKLTELVEGIRKRNVFFAPGAELLRRQEEAASAVNIAQIVKDLKLVGVIWGKAPQAIIEDSKEQKTYFLTEGQMFGNSITIKKILQNSVILSRDSEEMEFH